MFPRHGRLGRADREPAPRRGTPHTESDVDLAVEGLPSALYFHVLADLMELFGTRVDLVDLERAPESLRDRISETGLET